MIQFIIPGIIILISLVIIAVIIIRHFPQAASIDVDSLPAEQEAAMKAALMERRLKRKLTSGMNKSKLLFRRIFKGFASMSKSMQSRVSQLEQKYRKKAATMTVQEQEDVKQKIRIMLEQAEQQVESDQLLDAEQKYIEILSWDAKNLPAYFGLNKLYMKKKQFNQAKETADFLIRLIEAIEKGNDNLSKLSSNLTDAQINEVYYDQSICLQVQKQYQKALEQIEKALQRDSNNPKFLDKKIEISILLNNKDQAQQAFDLLKDVNPDNQKLEGLQEKIRQI